MLRQRKSIDAFSIGVFSSVVVRALIVTYFISIFKNQIALVLYFNEIHTVQIIPTCYFYASCPSFLVPIPIPFLFLSLSLALGLGLSLSSNLRLWKPSKSRSFRSIPIFLRGWRCYPPPLSILIIDRSPEIGGYSPWPRTGVGRRKRPHLRMRAMRRVRVSPWRVMPMQSRRWGEMSMSMPVAWA